MLDEKRRLVIAFLAPAVIIYLVFFLFPAVQSLYLSLFEWRGFGKAREFVGMANFRSLLGFKAQLDDHFPFVHLKPKDPTFWLTTRTTLMYTLVGGLLTFLVAFFFTATMAPGVRGRKFFRMMIFLPNVIAPIVLATLWGFILNPQFGLLSGALDALGFHELSKIPWMSTSRLPYFVLIGMVWVWVGFYLVLLMAGVDQIPTEMFDAARVDGANVFQVFFLVTLPLIWYVLTLAVIYFAVGGLKVFEFPYVFHGRYPPKQIWTLSIYTYLMGFGAVEPIYRLGYASSIGVTMQVLVVVGILLSVRILRRLRIRG